MDPHARESDIDLDMTSLENVWQWFSHRYVKAHSRTACNVFLGFESAMQHYQVIHLG